MVAMTRRNPNFRFILNTDYRHLEVHDLDNEKTGANQCQIDELMRGGNYKYLTIDTEAGLVVWLSSNPQYDGCAYCLPKYHRK